MILVYTDKFCNSTLRGGGVCTSSSQTKNNPELNQQQGNFGIANQLTLRLANFYKEIEEVKDMLETQKGKEVLVKYVKWYEDTQQQFFYYLDYKIVQWNSETILMCFSQCLSIIPSLIKREKLLSLQLLKICNGLSRIIFYYFTNKDNQEKCEQVGEWQESIQQIKKHLENEGELQLFYNGICFELSIIELCTGALPTLVESDTDKELLKSAFFGFVSSVVDLSISDDLKGAVKDGAQQLYKKYQKYQSQEKFMCCFNFELLKWIIIDKLESENQFEKTEKIILETYTKIVTKKNDWYILYSWIKIISELMIYKPKITKENFLKVQELEIKKIDWDNAIQLKYIKPIRGHENLAEINLIKEDSTLCIHLKSVLTNFEKLQDLLIIGSKDLPPFEKYYKLNQVEMINNDEITDEEQKIQQIIERINNIPFQEISNYITELIQVFQNYQNKYDIINDKQSFTEGNQQEYQRSQLSNLKYLYNLNQQLLERIISYSTFQIYMKELLLKLTNLCGDLEENMKSQTTMHILVSFVQLGLKCYSNYKEIKEEQFIQKTFEILPEKTLEKEIELLDSERKKNTNFTKSYDIKKKNESFQFNQQLFKALESYGKFQLNLDGLIQKLFEDEQRIIGQLIQFKNPYNNKEFIQESSQNNENNIDLQVIEDQVNQNKNKQEEYQIIISIFKAIQCSVLDFKEILQDNLIIQDLKENLNKKANKQIEFEISLTLQLQLFDNYFKDQIKFKIKTIDYLYHSFQTHQKSGQQNLEMVKQSILLINDQIVQTVEILQQFQQNFQQLYDISFKKQKKSAQKYEFNFQNLDNQMNQFFNIFQKIEENDKINLQETFTEQQGQTQLNSEDDKINLKQTLTEQQSQTQLNQENDQVNLKETLPEQQGQAQLNQENDKINLKEILTELQGQTSLIQLSLIQFDSRNKSSSANQLMQLLNQLMQLLNFSLSNSEEGFDVNQQLLKKNLIRFQDLIQQKWNKLNSEPKESYQTNENDLLNQQQQLENQKKNFEQYRKDIRNLINSLQNKIQKLKISEIISKISYFQILPIKDDLINQITQKLDQFSEEISLFFQFKDQDSQINQISQQKIEKNNQSDILQQDQQNNLDQIEKIEQIGYSKVQFQNEDDQVNQQNQEQMNGYKKIDKEIKQLDQMGFFTVLQNFTQGFYELIKIINSDVEYVQKITKFFHQNMHYFNNQKKELIQSQMKYKNQGVIQKINDVIQSNFWRVKEGFVFQCIYIQNSLSEINKEKIAKNFILISAREKDERILRTIHNKEIIQQSIQLYNKFWKEMESVIETDLQTLLRNLDQIQIDLKNCDNESQRQILLEEHNKLEQEIDQQIANVSSIGDALGITMKFLKDIRKDLAAVQSKLEKISQQIHEFSLDIKYLRGKTPFQLFELRMQKVLQQKKSSDRKNVYVKLRTKELIVSSKNEEDEETTLFSDHEQNFGEIDEFLIQQKDSLLIHGPAGSGKSVAAQKIEEFIWLQYKEYLDQPIKTSKDITLQKIPLIPIFIQLSSLRNPLQEAVEESLQSSLYNFDQKQILDLKELVAQGRVKVLFILDSYDELNQNFIQKNLNVSNKLKSWKFDTMYIENLHSQNLDTSTIGYYPKMITTTRSESLQSSNYQEWFLSDSNSNFSKYKEIRILTFDQQQQQEYIKQFSLLQVKLIISEFLETLNQFQTKKPNFDRLDEQISVIVQEQLEKNDFQQEKILNDQQIKIIIQLLKGYCTIEIRKESEDYLLKELSKLWSVKTFEKYINEFNLQQLLVTPFMMKIVVEVLPQITQDLTSAATQGASFMRNYQEKLHFKYIYSINKQKQKDQLQSNLQKLRDVNSKKDVTSRQQQEQNSNIESSVLSKNDETRNQSGIQRKNQITNDNKGLKQNPRLDDKQNQNYKEEMEFLFQQVDFTKMSDDIENFKSVQKLKAEVIQEIILCSQTRWQQIINNSIPSEFASETSQKVINQCKKQFFLTPYDFYEAFYNNYIKRNLKKISNVNNSKSLIDYSAQISHYSMIFAQLLMKKQMIGVDYQQKGIVNLSTKKQENNDEFFELFDETAPNAGIIQQFRKCIPLKQKGNFVSFEHKSIQEYLFAKSIYENISNILTIYQNVKSLRQVIINIIGEKNTKQLIIQQLKKIFVIIKSQSGNSEEEINNIFQEKMKANDSNQEFKKFLTYMHQLKNQISSSPLNQFTLSSEFYLGTLKFLSEKIKQNQKLRKILKFLIGLSKYFIEFIIISSNALSLLVFMQEFFQYNDFSNLRIKDISLIGMKCFGCDFSHSYFTDVKMIGVNLNYCNLSEAKWNNILTSDLPEASSDLQSYRKMQENEKKNLDSQIIRSSYSADGELIAALSSRLIIFRASNLSYLMDIGVTGQKVINFCWGNIPYQIAICFSKKIECAFLNNQQYKLLGVIEANESPYALQFSKQNNYLAIGFQTIIIIVDPKDNLKTLHRVPVDSTNNVVKIISSLDFSLDEQQFIAASGKSFFLFQKIQKQPLLLQQTQQQQQQIESEHKNKVWEQKILIEQENEKILNLCYSSNGLEFAVSYVNCKIQIWNRSGKLILTIECSKPIWGMQYSSNNYLVTGGEDNIVQQWNTSTKEMIKEFKGHTDCIFSISFSKPYENIILSGSKDGTIKQWHAQNNQQLNEYLHGHDEEILFVIISNDQQRIISKGKDKKIIQWNSQTGEILNPSIILNGCIQCRKSQLCEDCCKSPILSINDDEQIVTGGNGEQLLIFDAFDGKIVGASKNDGLPGKICNMIYSQPSQKNSEQNFIIYSTEKKIFIHYFTKQIEQKELEISGEIFYMFLSNQQDLIVIDNFVKLSIYNVNDLTLKSPSPFELNSLGDVNQIQLKKQDSVKIRGIEYIPFSNQRKTEKQIISCMCVNQQKTKFAYALTNNNIYFYQIDNLEKQLGNISHDCSVTAMCFQEPTQEQNYLVTCGIDLAFRVYIFKDNKLLSKGYHKLCHQNTIIGIITGGQNFLLSWSTDKSIKIWQIAKFISKDKDMKELQSKIDIARKELQLITSLQKQNEKIKQIVTFYNQRTSQFCKELQNKYDKISKDDENFQNQSEKILEKLRQYENFHLNMQLDADQDVDEKGNAGKTQEKGENQQNSNKVEKNIVKEKQDDVDYIIKLLDQRKMQFASDRKDFLANVTEEINVMKQAISEEKVKQIKEGFVIQEQQVQKILENQKSPQSDQIEIEQLYFKEYLSLSKFPQITTFIGTKLSTATISSAKFPNLVDIWIKKQKKYESLNK